MVSTPLQPFRMFTAKRSLRRIVPCRSTSWPRRSSATPLARATQPVNGSITASLTGRHETSANPPPKSKAKATRKRASRERPRGRRVGGGVLMLRPAS